MIWVWRCAPLLFTAVLLGIVVALDPAFQRGAYWRFLLHNYFPVAILALALTPIVISAGIDLSAGSLTVLSSVIVGVLWRDAGWPIEWALLGGIAAGALAGSINGALVARGVMPLVATLATRELYRGLARRLSGVTGITGFPASLSDWWNSDFLTMPLPLIGLIAIASAAYVVMHHTWIGRMVFALGDNETAARFAGVPAPRLKVMLFTVSGTLAGLCGASVVCEYGSAKSDVFTNLELTAIAAVVLGGVKVTGGHGHIAGVLLGTISLAALLSGLNRVAAEWRDTITGSLLIVVAIVNEFALRQADRLALRKSSSSG